jgi:predicted dehydrogenase
MAGDAVRVALVGAGFFARFHLDAWLRMGGARLVAVCDRNPETHGHVADDTTGHETRTGEPIAVYEDFGAMLDAGSPEVVDIATPPESHLSLVEAAAARGLGIICQKPLAPTMEEAVRVVETCERAGVLLAVHENIRWTPWHREIARLIGAGTLGTLHRIGMRLRPGDGQGADAYLARQPYFQQMPRFLVHETAIHWIDTFRFLMGEVTGVFARLERLNPAIAGEDSGVIVFAFEGGATGYFDGNRLNDHVSDNARRTMGEMWVEGSAGVLRLDGAARLWWKPHGEAEAEHAYEWHDRGFAGDAVFATQAHVISHLRDGTPLENCGRAYLRNLLIEEAIYRSNDEGRWIDTSPV